MVFVDVLALFVLVGVVCVAQCACCCWRCWCRWSCCCCRVCCVAAVGAVRLVGLASRGAIVLLEVFVFGVVFGVPGVAAPA